jgi:hypothetical protein
MSYFISKSNVERFLGLSFLYFIIFGGANANLIIKAISFIVICLNIYLFFVPEWRNLVFNIGQRKLFGKTIIFKIGHIIYFLTLYITFILFIYRYINSFI